MNAILVTDTRNGAQTRLTATTAIECMEKAIAWLGGAFRFEKEK